MIAYLWALYTTIYTSIMKHTSIGMMNLCRRENTPKAKEPLKYPLAITELTRDQLDLLVDVLAIDSPYDAQRTSYIGQKRGPKTRRAIKRAIRRLPWELYRNYVLRLIPKKIVNTAVLCDVHKELNPFIIEDAVILLKREVTENVAVLEWSVDRVSEEVKSLLRALQSIAGMWWSPKGNKSFPPLGALPMQHNKCEACILARVVTDPPCLQNLRTALVSRTKSDGEDHRPRKLHAFIEAAIRRLEENLALEIAYRSSNRAFPLKSARKHGYALARAQSERLLTAPEPLGPLGAVARRDIIVNSKVPVAMFMNKEKAEKELSERQAQLFGSVEYDTIADGIIAKYADSSRSNNLNNLDLSCSSFDTIDTELSVARPLNVRKYPENETGEAEKALSDGEQEDSGPYENGPGTLRHHHSDGQLGIHQPSTLDNLSDQ
ncbi:hypothetical protein BO71DRAFT_219546 [Aspergillus ellipticus CBS 707.79]|uniref:Uncharacterized protein n=1 Tax=Aspergillus ellipticus CBS 707.79 TaxID=1448320 RepID=A0A319DBS0_9EURO|nr:hypothetical protein BO71DRAFT_219546 [Aspergillus ellipticus CBS 707.79]